MNFKVAALLSTKTLKPDFIKQKDIRKITPEFLMNRFKDKVTTSSFNEHGADFLVLKIARKNGQTPDIYIFRNGKFANRYVQREKNGIKHFISTCALENGFVTKTIEKNNDTNKTWAYCVETVIDTVKKTKKGLLGKLSLADEALDVRIKRHKILEGVAEETAIKKYMPLWTITLSDNINKLRATCTPSSFFVLKVSPNNWFKFSSDPQLRIGENIENLINKALKWFDGEFKN